MAIPAIDPELCTGCGLCETICPEVFEMGDNGLAHVIDEEGCEEAGCCQEAVESCPEEAITLQD